MQLTVFLRRTMARRLFAAVLLAVPAALSAQGPGTLPGAAPALQRPLPETSAFLAEVRRHVRLDSIGQAAYTCVQRETEAKLDGNGKPTETSTLLYEVYPPTSAAGPYRRLISRNGVAVPAAELAESDRKHRGELEESARRLQQESASDRDKRIRHEAGERRERQALLDEVFRLLDVRVVGREWLAGRPAIVLAFAARPGMEPSSRMGAMVQKLIGRAWVDEEDVEVVRVEARAADDVTYGFGMFARIYKGTTVLWERQKVNGEAWMPVRLEIRASARVLLFRRLALHRIVDYFDYRKSASSASTTFGPPR